MVELMIILLMASSTQCIKFTIEVPGLERFCFYEVLGISAFIYRGVAEIFGIIGAEERAQVRTRDLAE